MCVRRGVRSREIRDTDLLSVESISVESGRPQGAGDAGAACQAPTPSLLPRRGSSARAPPAPSLLRPRTQVRRSRRLSARVAACGSRAASSTLRLVKPARRHYL
jgi:hypothetical protein